MMAETLTTRMAVMPDLVRDLEQRVGNGEVPPEGLDNVKAAIDDSRLRQLPHEELAELRLAADKLASQVEQKFGPR
jgi:hypothetical protein